MVTRATVTKRTHFDWQPISRIKTESEKNVLGLRDARLLTLGEAANLVQWLNTSMGTASHDRVVLIRRELEGLPRAYQTHRDAYIHVGPRSSRSKFPRKKLQIQRQLHKRHVALSRMLLKYIFRPRAAYGIFEPRWFFGMVSDDRRQWFKIRIGYQTITEADAVLALVRLASTGDLEKVRLCEMCNNRWRVAAKRSYRFCSAECREIFYAKSPEYHDRKAANQRAYRARLKQKEVDQDLRNSLKDG